MLIMVEPNDIDADLLSAKFGLSKLEAKFLQLMITHNDASKEDVPEVNFAIRQLIYTLRRKLNKIGGVYIVNDGDGHYSLPKISKRLLREKLRTL